ncbi:MAG: chondroitinase-B domain-containing protein [Verrucomicrobiales bacterium]|nr:chondroitinase-B domain-containing protein [Verrucomicrobiota bacterium JB025]
MNSGTLEAERRAAAHGSAGGWSGRLAAWCPRPPGIRGRNRLMAVWPVIGVLIACGARSGAAEYAVATAAELENLPALSAGDRVTLADGDYDAVDATIEVSGTAGNEVEISAATAGGARFTGGTRIVLSGEYAVVSGLSFDGGGGPVQKEGIVKFAADSSHLTLRNCLFRDFDGAGQTDANWLFVEGYDHLVTRCSFIGKTSLNSTVFIKPTEGAGTKTTPRNHVLSFCYFGPRTVIGDNGYESIRIADSTKQDYEMHCLIESNYFYQAISSNAASEMEVISNKSRGNIYRGNVFEDCDGQLTLRHGRNCVVEGNCFLGTGGSRESGVRVIGTGHTVRNNYIENVNGDGLRSAICVMDGEYGLTDNQYEGVEYPVVEGNVIVNCKRPMNFGENKGLNDPPRYVTLKDNRISNAAGGPVFEIEADVDFTLVSGNVVYSANGNYGDVGLLAGGYVIDPEVDVSRPFDDIVERDETGHEFDDGVAGESRDSLGIELIAGEGGRIAKLSFPAEGGRSYQVEVSEDLVKWVAVPGVIEATASEVREVEVGLDGLESGGQVAATDRLFFVVNAYQEPAVEQLAWVESGGEVVIEAEMFTSRETNGDSGDWVVGSDAAGAVDSYIETLSGSSATWESGAEVSYLVRFSTAGTYYFHPRVMADDGSSDSLYFGTGGSLAGQCNTGTTTGWAWDNNESEEIVIPSAGNHWLTVRRREAGLRLDRLVLTMAEGAEYADAGPAASARVPTIE